MNTGDVYIFDLPDERLLTPKIWGPVECRDRRGRRLGSTCGSAITRVSAFKRCLAAREVELCASLADEWLAIFR